MADKLYQSGEDPFADSGVIPSGQDPFAQSAPAKKPDSVLSRTMAGLADPIYGAGQIMDKVLVNPIRQTISPGATSMDDVIRQRDAEYNAPEGFDVARMAGNIANPISWAGGGAGVGRAAAGGAFQSALAPTNPDESFMQQKAMQAGLGGAGGAVLAKALRGFTPIKEAKALMDQGIQPSFGQSMGGMTNNIEQKLTSVPFVGDAVQYARNRPMDEFQQQVLDRATARPGMVVGGKPVKSLDDANTYANSLYQDVVPYLKPTPEAATMANAAITKALNNPELTDQYRKILLGITENHAKAFDSSDLTGAGIKRLDSELGHLARKYSSGDPLQKTLAAEIYRVQTALREGLETGLPAELQGKMAYANKVWRDLIPINQAASARTDERIMPRSLQKAMARQQKTDVTRMKPDALIDNALKVLPQTVPDSGTAGRAMLGGGALMGGGALGVLPQMMAVGIPAGLGATRPVQRALVGNTSWQKALQPFDARTAQIMSAALRDRREKKKE